MSGTATAGGGTQHHTTGAAGGPPRVGSRVTLGARVTGAIPDGAAATVRVYDKAQGGKVIATLQGTVTHRRVDVPWTVLGQAGRRTQELQYEFDVEAGGKRTPREPLHLQPERLVEVQIAGGHGGGVVVEAHVPLYNVKKGACEVRATFGAGELARLEIPRGYQGAVSVTAGGQVVARLQLDRLPLGPTDPIQVRANLPAAPVAALRAPLPRALSDATRTPDGARADARALAAAREQAHELADWIYVHRLGGGSPLPDGHHEADDSMPTHVKHWLVAQIFEPYGPYNSYVAPAAVQIKQNWKLLLEGRTRFYIKDGKYIIFKGNPRLRKVLTGPRYRLDNKKVFVLTGGARDLAGVAKATRGALRDSGVGLAIVAAFDVARDIAEDKGLTDILVDVASDTVKGIIGTVISVGLLAGAAAMASGIIAAAPIGVVVVVGIIVGIGVAIVLDKADEHFHVTDHVRAYAHKVEEDTRPQREWLADEWQRHIVDPLVQAKDSVVDGLGEVERGIYGMYGLPQLGR